MEKLYIIVEVYVHNRYRIATRFLKALDCKSFCAKYCSQVPCPPEREGVLTKKKSTVLIGQRTWRCHIYIASLQPNAKKCNQ
jgi:hypothetical protein